MRRKCAVNDCETKSSPMHSFPNPKKFPAVCNKWIVACGNKELLTMNSEDVYRRKKVCHAHFTGNDIYSNKILRRDAIPSLHLPHQHQLESSQRKICTSNKMDGTYTNENLNGNNSTIQEEFDDGINTTVCISDTFITGGYVKQESCDTEIEPGIVHIKEEITEDLTVVVEETRRITDCTDDKVCINATVITERCLQEEPCDTEKNGSICNYLDIKNENIDDRTVIIQETGLTTDTKGNNLIRCDQCGEEYDLYCIKCPMLIRIFDSNNPNAKINRVRWTLPENFVDICETSSGAGVMASRIIPKGVVFGPFEGLDSIKDGAVSKWKSKNKELAYTKDPKGLNWMQYIRKADRNSHRNLIPFQYEDELYYHSDCHIGVGDELLVRWDSDGEGGDMQDTEDSYWEPRVYETLDNSFACTFCCVGYKSICHLTAHNSRCPEKINREDFCKDVVQCAFCKIYLDKREYSDYHMDRCCDRNTKKYVAVCSAKDYAKYSRESFECRHCGERFTRPDFFALHKKKKHFASVYRCDRCVFETNYPLDFVRHLDTSHKGVRSYRCNSCGKQFKLEKTLLAHVKNLHNEKKRKYKCLMCDFETIQPQGIKFHLLKIHGGVRRFKCTRCAFKTCFKITFQHHLRYHEDPESCSAKSPVEDEEEEDGIADKGYRCYKCEYRTYRKRNFNQHMAVHNIDRPYKCDKCSQTFKGKEGLTQHARNVHSNADVRRYKCPQCPFDTNYKHSFRNHVNKHEKCELFQCTKCDYNSYHKDTFVQHRIRHERKKKHVSHVRPFRTDEGGELDEHLRTHGSQSEDLEDNGKIRAENEAVIGPEGLKSFGCPTCDKTFKYKAHLVRHRKCLHASEVKDEKPSVESDD